MAKKIQLMLSIFLVIAFVGCGGGGGGGGGGDEEQNPAQGNVNQDNEANDVQNRGFALTSTDITEGGTLDAPYTSQAEGGSNTSPALSWGSAPEGTKSFAILVYDPDADFFHWAVYDIPATVTSISRGVSVEGIGASAMENGSGEEAYFGAEPPTGDTHHYIFTVYALNADSSAGNQGQTLTDFIQAHMIEQSSITVTYTGK